MSGGIDVIGDVHGQDEMLETLLARMGYADDGRSWRHPTRTVMFIGDLIDRNPGQLGVLDIARRMVDSGAARIVMGNHEFNAIAWATRHPDRPDDYLRPHTKKNRDQHKAFLEAVGEDSEFHHQTVEWFKTFPLWCEVAGARFVHTCWDPTAVALLSPQLGPNNTLTHEVLVAASTKETPEYNALEHLLKGPELQLPEGAEYLDKGGHCRDHARFAWWHEDADTLARGALIPEGTTRCDGSPYPALADTKIAQPPVPPYRDAVPLFVGHYWRTGEQALLSEHVACVDYSAGARGPLVAYRWDGETLLSADKFETAEASVGS